MQLVLVEIVGGVEAIEAALAVTAFDHVGAADEDDRDELERCVYRIHLVLRHLVFELRQAPVVAQ